MFRKSSFRTRRSIFNTVWPQVDWLLLALSISLTIFGGIMIRSAELNMGWTDWHQHWIIGGIGLAIALMLAAYPYQNLILWRWPIYAVITLSLLAVDIIGTTELGAQRWISIGGFNVQPSEFAKVGMIITLAAILQSKPASKIINIVQALALTSIPWLLVFIQPDLGTSLVFGAITLGMLYWANANPCWLLLMVSPLVSAILYSVYLNGWLFWMVIVAVLAWFSLPWYRLGSIAAVLINIVSGKLALVFWGLLKDYQKDRLVLFLNPEKDPLGGGYHLIQSRIAIGAGEMTGQGINQGSQTQLNFIPEQHTDFIFSAIGEEFGFIGGVVVLLVFWLLCWRLIHIARTSQDNFGGLLAIGVLSMIVFQVVVNIGMTIGLAPVTGIPLPWISYGRSALLTNFIALGIVESVANHRPKEQY